MATDNAGNSAASNNNGTGKLTLNLGNLRTFEHSSSAAINIGGFKWHLDMSKAANNTHNCGYLLDAHIFCQLDESSSVEKLWMCKAEVKLNLQSFGTTKSGEFFFFNGRTHYHWAGVMFFMDGSVNYSIEMEVALERHNLHLSVPSLDTDLKMEFNGKEERVAVNKTILAGFSSYFQNLFFGTWSERAAEGKGDEFGIKEDDDFDVNAFKLMLCSAMAMGWMVHEGKFLQAQSAMTILKLSIKYDVPMLQDYCQKYLQDSADCPKMDLLAMAEQFGLQQLKDHCLATISAIDVVDNFVHNAEICARLRRSTQQVLNERMAENAKKMRQQQAQAGAAAAAAAATARIAAAATARFNQAAPAANAAGVNAAAANANERRNQAARRRFGGNRRQRRQNALQAAQPIPWYDHDELMHQGWGDGEPFDDHWLAWAVVDDEAPDAGAGEEVE